MRHRFIYIAQLIVLILSPVFVFSQAVCSSSGYTILTINGVLTDEREAQINKEKLSALFGFSKGTFNSEKITFDYLHNPSHFAGGGDIAKTLAQMMNDGKEVDDYDLTEMLKSASEKVKTRKLLIVGHSQGNFYANAFYKKASVPLESTAVYSVATPSSYVAGGGEYITSETDKMIAGLVARVLRKDILPPNTRIEEVANDTGLTTGHSFSDVYLKYRGAEIVGGIEAALGKLKSEPSYIPRNVGTSENTTTTCIPAPADTLAHKATGLMFAVADPVANEAKSNIASSAENVAAWGRALAGAATKVTKAVANIRESKPIVVDNATIGAAVALANTIPGPVPIYPSILPASSADRQNTEIDSVTPAEASEHSYIPTFLGM